MWFEKFSFEILLLAFFDPLFVGKLVQRIKKLFNGLQFFNLKSLKKFPTFDSKTQQQR